MSRVTRSATERSQPIWAADYLSRDHLVPAPAMVDLDQFGGVAPASGTVVGRTFAEADAGAKFGPAAALDEEVFVLAFNASEYGEAVLYRPGSTIRINYLPGYDVLAAEVKALVRTAYNCIQGAA